MWVTFGKWIKEGGDVGSDLVLGFGLFTTFEEAGDAGLFDSFGDECGSGNGVGFPELLDLVVVGGEGWSLGTPVAEETGFLGGAAFFGGECFVGEWGELVAEVGNSAGEREAEAADVEGLVVIGIESAVALGEVGF